VRPALCDVMSRRQRVQLPSLCARPLSISFEMRQVQRNPRLGGSGRVGLGGDCSEDWGPKDWGAEDIYTVSCDIMRHVVRLGAKEL